MNKNKNGKTPLDVAKAHEIKQYIINHPWYRRRQLLLTRPHDDHETNKEHKLKPLSEIITATQRNNNVQIKIKISSYL